MSEENVLNIIHVLLQLIQHTDWTTRHGGLLGLKYLLIVRKVSLTNMFIFYYFFSFKLFILCILKSTVYSIFKYFLNVYRFAYQKINCY